MMLRLVLVTGGTGFIAQHCMLALLEAGYRVRTTLRMAALKAEVRGNLKAGGADPAERLSFVTADLSDDRGWGEAAAGVPICCTARRPRPPEARSTKRTGSSPPLREISESFVRTATPASSAWSLPPPSAQ